MGTVSEIIIEILNKPQMMWTIVDKAIITAVIIGLFAAAVAVVWIGRKIIHRVKECKKCKK